MTTNKILVFLFVLLSLSLLFLNFTSAFQIESNILTNTVCPSSTIVIEEKITADRAANFEATSSGSASSFATVLPISFYLDKDQTKYIYVYITPPSNTLPGKYNLIITVANGYDVKQVSHEIFVENCNEIIINLEKPQDVCSCEEKVQSIKIKNNGLYTERYNITLKGIEFGRLSTNSLILKPKEEKNILIYFKPSCNIEENIYNFTIKAESLDSNAMAITNGQIKVVNCYNYVVDVEKDFYSICDGDKEIIELSIWNKGRVSNFYEINLQGAEFANIEKRSISLNPNEKANIKIYLAPKFGEVGKYNLKIKTLSDKGKILVEKQIDIDVRECHNFDFSIKVDKERDRICNGLNKSYELELKNKGEKIGDYILKLNAPLWIKLEKSNVTLNPNQSSTILLIASPLYTTKPDKYKIKIEARDRNSEAKKSLNFEIETVGKVDCYKPKINLEKKKIDVERDKSYVVLATIENIGERKATYLISISGDANRFTKVNPSVLEIEPGKAEEVYLYIAPPINLLLGTYNLSLHVRVNETGIIESENLIIDVKEKIEEEVEEVKEEEVEKVRWFDKIINFFKSIFGKKQTAKQELKLEQSITNQTANQSSNEEIEKLIETLTNESEGEKLNFSLSSFKESLPKVRYYLIGFLVLIALILTGLVIFQPKAKPKSKK